MNAKEIRKSFLEFFIKKNHKFIRSSPVVPIGDPTLLFTNAGMNQFKSIFLNESKSEYSRAVNSQKCIRVSGKHNDLEEVGVDTFHHTFFEMLGNWSFGDYYKKEAIKWSWELLTEEWALDKNRLWATVYNDDEEALKLWMDTTDIDPKRIIKCGDKDNFWEMGDTGPCGPCSEIHYFVGDDIEKQDAKGVNVSDEYWELWNLVFIQYNRRQDGTLDDLPKKHVDTGAGLERIATVLQNKKSNYDNDLFLPIIIALQEIAGSSYSSNPIPHRVISDHIRMLCFSIGDGALPSNDGRGYVLRRILRRASKFGRNIGLENPFLFQLVSVVGEIMKDVFPEILEKKSHIEKVILSEEESFNNALDRGLYHFEKSINSLKGKTISGEQAFKLYDTYGFPLDLTVLLAREKNLLVDKDGFESCMDDQRKKAKAKGKFSTVSDEFIWEIVSKDDDSKFLGYDKTDSISKITRFCTKGDNLIYLVLNQTPFYAESGGQVGDTGTIFSKKDVLRVLDVKKDKDSFIHICEGRVSDPNSPLNCTVDIKRRASIKNNHTATHLMHKALKNILGTHVNQAGSLVHPDYLRFDLTHFEKITSEEIRKIENQVNDQILTNIPLNVTIKSFDSAKEDGAEALFGEKYGEEVRVVQIGDYSMELCGGTHVNRTGDIGLFKIVEESSLSSGVRRIVALTGKKAIMDFQEKFSLINNIQGLLNTAPNEMLDRINTILTEKKLLEKKIKSSLALNVETEIFSNVKSFNNYQMLVKKINVSSMDDLKKIGDQIYKKLANGIVTLFSDGQEKPMVVVVVGEKLTKMGIHAGQIAKSIGSYMDGGGGGKPHMATAGGKNTDLISNAMNQSELLIRNMLKEK